MQPIGRRLLLFPQRRLRFVTIPGILLPRHMAVENRFMLKFVSAKSPRERILAPDDLTTDGEADRLQGVLKFALPRRGMTDVEGGARLDCATQGLKAFLEETLKLFGTHPVVLNRESL